MDVRKAAVALNGNQYREEGSRELFESMKDINLVAVFGASDDLIEFRGAIYDEEYLGSGDISEILITAQGIYKNKCENEDCPNFDHTPKDRYIVVRAVFGPDDEETSWAIDMLNTRTKVPYESFTIMEDDEVYCRGLVFDMNCLVK